MILLHTLQMNLGWERDNIKHMLTVTSEHQSNINKNNNVVISVQYDRWLLTVQHPVITKCKKQYLSNVVLLLRKRRPVAKVSVVVE